MWNFKTLHGTNDNRSWRRATVTLPLFVVFRLFFRVFEPFVTSKPIIRSHFGLKLRWASSEHRSRHTVAEWIMYRYLLVSAHNFVCFCVWKRSRSVETISRHQKQEGKSRCCFSWVLFVEMERFQYLKDICFPSEIHQKSVRSCVWKRPKSVETISKHLKQEGKTCCQVHLGVVHRNAPFSIIWINLYFFNNKLWKMNEVHLNFRPILWLRMIGLGLTNGSKTLKNNLKTTNNRRVTVARPQDRVSFVLVHCFEIPHFSHLRFRKSTKIRQSSERNGWNKVV